MFTATYSPTDNKLRLYSTERLDSATYAELKQSGFKWAPKQNLFVAPIWTPQREDLLLSLCDEITDDDTSLVDRAEERAERFEEYSDKRSSDAAAARDYAKSIADNIPFGQPILIGHHSEKRARKDAERIENGMRKAVKMWECSEYWENRAKGALRHAKYKERPDVRARRIKGIEADKRKFERDKASAEKFTKAWQDPRSKNLQTALSIADYDHVSKCFTLAEYPRVENIYEGMQSLWSALRDTIITPGQAAEIAIRVHERTIEHCDRWITHIDNRLLYERAMLDEQGGTIADINKPEKGGACKCVFSPRGGWSYIQKVNKVSITILDNWGNGGSSFSRTIPFDKLGAIMNKSAVDVAMRDGLLIETQDKAGFYLKEAGQEIKLPASKFLPPEIETNDVSTLIPVHAIEKESNEFEAMRDSLKAGVRAVSAPQLFPTPPEIAEKMVEWADLQNNDTILEPSAGTGNILKAIPNLEERCAAGLIKAVEINHPLVKILNESMPYLNVLCDDFLQTGDIPRGFSKIIMNPPFKNGEDIEHIAHALTKLTLGGTLVALCANGSRQREKLMPYVTQWEDLPQGSFKCEGTSVNVAMLKIII